MYPLTLTPFAFYNNKGSRGGGARRAAACVHVRPLALYRRRVTYGLAGLDDRRAFVECMRVFRTSFVRASFIFLWQELGTSGIGVETGTSSSEPPTTTRYRAVENKHESVQKPLQCHVGARRRLNPQQRGGGGMWAQFKAGLPTRLIQGGHKLTFSSIFDRK